MKMKQTFTTLILFLFFASCASAPAIPSTTAPEPTKAVPVEETTNLPGVHVKSVGTDYTVTWVFDEPEGSEVGLVGNFQEWNPDGAYKMEKNEKGYWSVTLPAKISDIFIYKYIVDGQWFQDPNAPDGESDGYGGRNGKIIVRNLAKR
jgi:1,4-alpha-glucan branching enzyme